MKRIILIEDDSETSKQISEILDASQHFSVQGVFSSAETCLDSLPREVQVALVDLGLPGMSGIQLIAELKRREPQLACVAYTVFADKQNVLGALKAGAEGYLLKGRTGEQLLQSLRTLEHGGAPLTPQIARLLITNFQTDQSPLSAREREVLNLLADGYTYKQCASELFISNHTVHDHVKRIYQKLQVGSKSEAVSKAKRRGWLE